MKFARPVGLPGFFDSGRGRARALGIRLRAGSGRALGGPSPGLARALEPGCITRRACDVQVNEGAQWQDDLYGWKKNHYKQLNGGMATG